MLLYLCLYINILLSGACDQKSDQRKDVSTYDKDVEKGTFH